MDDKWFTKDENGVFVPLGSQEEIDAAMTAGRPIFIAGADEPAKLAISEGWPSGWTEVGSTRDDSLPPRIEEVLRKGGTIRWRSA